MSDQLLTQKQTKEIVRGLKSFDVNVDQKQTKLMIDHLLYMLNLANYIFTVVHDPDLTKAKKVAIIKGLKDPLGKKFLNQKNAERIYTMVRRIKITDQKGGFILWALEQIPGWGDWFSIIFDILTIILEVVSIGLDIFSFTGIGAVAQLVPDILSIILALLRLDFITVLLTIFGLIPYVGIVGELGVIGWKGYKIIKTGAKIGKRLT